MTSPMDGISTMQTTNRESASLVTTILQRIISPFRPHLVTPKKTFPPGSPRLDIHRSARKSCQHTERQVQGIWIYDLSSSRSKAPHSEESVQAKPQKLRIYYFAGGGWQMPPSSQHWKLCAELCNRLPNAAVSIVSYPLAPNSPAPDTFPKILDLYRELVKVGVNEHETVVLAGDSSGANVALSLAVEAARLSTTRREGWDGLKHASAVLAISPCVDVGDPSQKVLETDKRDPVLTVPFTQKVGKTWAADWSCNDPRVSPVKGKVEVLREAGIQVLGVTGGNDVLTPDAVIFRDRCVEAGVKGKWLHWEKQMHCFPLTFCYGLGDGKEGLQWILDGLEEVRQASTHTRI